MNRTPKEKRALSLLSRHGVVRRGDDGEYDLTPWGSSLLRQPTPTPEPEPTPTPTPEPEQTPEPEPTPTPEPKPEQAQPSAAGA